MPEGSNTYRVSDVAVRVKRQFGDEAGVQVTDADIFRWVNDGQREIAAKNDLLRTRAAADIVAGQNTYGNPPDVLRFISVYYDGNPLRHINFQEADGWILSQDPSVALSGKPTIWYSFANEILLYPKPDADIAGGLVSYYSQLPAAVTSLDNTIALPDRYFSRLLEFVMAQAYEMDDDWTAAGNKVSQLNSALQEASEEENTTQHAVYPSITVLPEDY